MQQMSTSEQPELSIAELEHMERTNPALRKLTLRLSAFQGRATYTQFLEAFYHDLRTIFDNLSETSHYRSNDCEDRITVDIIAQLKAQGYRAQHDSFVNGHVDIIVEAAQHKWMAEAKRDYNLSKILKGFRQIFTRYTPGVSYNRAGTESGMLIYVQKSANGSALMEKWLAHLKKFCQRAYGEAITSNQCTDCDLFYYTEHTHFKSGHKVKIKHMPVLLRFDPQDRG